MASLPRARGGRAIRASRDGVGETRSSKQAGGEAGRRGDRDDDQASSAHETSVRIPPTKATIVNGARNAATRQLVFSAPARSERSVSSCGIAEAGAAYARRTAPQGSSARTSKSA